MNILKITQTHKCFVLELNDQKLYILNQKALTHQLKHIAKLTTTQVASITHMFEYQSVVEVDLTKAS